MPTPTTPATRLRANAPRGAGDTGRSQPRPDGPAVLGQASAARTRQVETDIPRRPPRTAQLTCALCGAPVTVHLDLMPARTLCEPCQAECASLDVVLGAAMELRGDTTIQEDPCPRPRG